MGRRKRYTRNLHRRLPTPQPWFPTVAWVRFQHATEGWGLFCYVADARPRLDPRQRRVLDELMAWFEANLDAPIVASGRFWFRAESRLCIEHARRLAQLLGAAGFPMVEKWRERRPGALGYQDLDQVEGQAAV